MLNEVIFMCGRCSNCSLDCAWMKALCLDFNDATLYSNRSLCFLHMGDGDKAYGDAYTCRMMRPDWPKACYRQGAALMLLKVRSFFFPLHNLKQICFCTHPTPYVYMQEYQKACDALLDGFKMDPGNSEIENALRYSISGYGFTAYLRVLVCDGSEWPTGLRSCASVNLEPIWFLVLLINTCKHFTEAWDAGARSNLLCHDVLRVYMYAGRRWSPWRYLMVLSWQPEWSVYTREPQPAGSFFLSFYLCFILPYALAAARAVELWICWPAAYC